MTDWPQRIPPDLNDRITHAMGMRECHPNDVWAGVREWLAQHEVPVPDSLPDYPTRPSRD